LATKKAPLHRLLRSLVAVARAPELHSTMHINKIDRDRLFLIY